jgi:hypothetical protein
LFTNFCKKLQNGWKGFEIRRSIQLSYGCVLCIVLILQSVGGYCNCSIGGILADFARNFIPALRGLIKVTGTDDVVAFENRARPLPCHPHGNALRDILHAQGFLWLCGESYEECDREARPYCKQSSWLA